MEIQDRPKNVFARAISGHRLEVKFTPKMVAVTFTGGMFKGERTTFSRQNLNTENPTRIGRMALNRLRERQKHVVHSQQPKSLL